MGVSLFTGRMKVFLLISVAGALLYALGMPLRNKYSLTHTHTLTENENFVAFEMSGYHRHTHSAL